MEKYDPLAINYKMDTLEDILSIPVPTEKFELPDDFMDSIEYVLQRKATEFKKEGDMECAIACLEKAVEIIPFSPMPYPDCFERLEKYLKLNNQWDEAEEVSLEGAKQEKNFQNEFKNKVLSDAAKLGTDLLEASYHEPASAKEAMYRGRVFSISGSDTRFLFYLKIFGKLVCLPALLSGELASHYIVTLIELLLLVTALLLIIGEISKRLPMKNMHLKCD